MLLSVAKKVVPSNLRNPRSHQAPHRCFISVRFYFGSSSGVVSCGQRLREKIQITKDAKDRNLSYVSQCFALSHCRIDHQHQKQFFGIKIQLSPLYLVTLNLLGNVRSHQVFCLLLFTAFLLLFLSLI